MKRNPSRLRQDIRRLEQARSSLIEMLLQVRDGLQRGSFVTLHRKCGKPSCHCVRSGGHPAKYLSIKEGGRTRLLYVPASSELAVAEATGRYRQFRESRSRLAKLSNEVLELVDSLGAALAKPLPTQLNRRAKERKDATA